MRAWSKFLSLVLQTFDLRSLATCETHVLTEESVSVYLLEVDTDLLFFLKIFWPCWVSCGLLVPQPRIKPMLPALETHSLNHWTMRKVRDLVLNEAEQWWGSDCCNESLTVKPKSTASALLKLRYHEGRSRGERSSLNLEVQGGGRH